MSSPSPALTPAEFFGKLGAHQSMMAVFDMAQHPEREPELRAAFTRMDDAIIGDNADAAHGIRQGLTWLLYVAANGLKIPKGEKVIDPLATGHTQLLARLSEGLSPGAAEAIMLARESPTTPSFVQATGARRKAGPLSNDILVEAAVTVVRALVDQHGDPGPESRWMVLGQLFGAICLGST
jgi:hypothetical protein